MPHRKLIIRGSKTQERYRQEYRLSLRVNVAISAIEAFFGLIVLVWLVRSVQYHDSSLDFVGMSIMPWFYYGTIALPCCGIWLWIQFWLLNPDSRRYLPITLLSIYYGVLLIACVWFTRLLVIDMWRRLLWGEA